MTNFSARIVADRGQPAAALHLVDKESFEDWLKTRPAEDRRLIAATRFKAKSGLAILPRGDSIEAVIAVDDRSALDPWSLAEAAARLPEGSYRLAEGEPGAAML